MHASFHRNEQDFRATVARGAIRNAHVVKTARTRNARVSIRRIASGVAILSPVAAALVVVIGGAP